MTRILQPDGTYCSAGPTCRRHGGKTIDKNAIAIPKEAFGASVVKSLNPSKPPIIVTPSVLSQPVESSSLNVTFVVEYEYDYYFCDGCYGCDTGEDYCRGSRYEGLRVESAANARVLSHIFSTPETALPVELIKLGTNIGLDDPESYYAYGEGGIYGDEAVVELNSDKAEELRKWFYSQDNADDAHGILEYCRSKGSHTKGLTPVEAVKNQIKEENKGRTNPRINKAVKATAALVDFASIKIPQPKHYDNVIPVTSSPATEKAQAFFGVVSKDRNGMYILEDGYHRLKGAKESKKKEGLFIILE